MKKVVNSEHRIFSMISPQHTFVSLSIEHKVEIKVYYIFAYTFHRIKSL